MRPGISRVVVEIIILVIAVALALLIFSPISGYIFGSLGRTATVGGAAQIQILNAQYDTTNDKWIIHAKNLGPGTISGFSSSDFRVYVDQKEYWPVDSVTDDTGATVTTWEKDKTIKVITKDATAARITTGSGYETKQHSIVLYGPGNTQTQYLYSPPPS